MLGSGSKIAREQRPIPMIFGGIYNTAKSKLFFEDNVGITPLILKESTSTNFQFQVEIRSKALPEDGRGMSFEIATQAPLDMLRLEVVFSEKVGEDEISIGGLPLSNDLNFKGTVHLPILTQGAKVPQ